MAPKHALGNVCEVVRRSDLFHIDPENIQIVEGWNARTDFSGEDELVEFIKEQGVPEPLLVRKTDDNRLELISGERRLRATLRAISEGSDIKSVPVIVAKKGLGQADLFIRDLCSNSGKPLGPVEESGAFRRLSNWGYSVKDISKKTGKSESHIRNRLELSNAITDVKNKLDKKEITISEAQKITRESGGDIEKQRAALVKTEPIGKTRSVTFKGSSPNKKGPCCVIEGLFADNMFLDAIQAAGYDPGTLKISVRPTK